MSRARNTTSFILDNVSRMVGGEMHLQPTDLELAAGSFNLLLGRTGAGKTTLSRVMAGLDRPTSGRLFLDGEDVTRRPVRRRSVAMVYQEFINYPNLTVFENVASPLRAAGTNRKEIEARVRETAELLHLEGCLDRLPAELSGGQQQRTALARALVKEAKLVLLDEPLVNLDYKLREELRGELREIFETRDAIIVYATADPIEALALGGHAVIIDRGRVIQQGQASAVYHTPENVVAAQVFSDPPMNLTEGRLGAATIHLGAGGPAEVPEHLRDLPDGPYLFGVRPHHIRTQSRDAAEICIPATVELAEISGSETSIHIDHDGGSWISLQDGIHPFDVGDPIDVFIEPKWVFAFARDGDLVAAPRDQLSVNRGAYRQHRP